MKITILISMTVSIALVCACCTSDPEAPATEKFLDEGSYGVHAGETFRYVEALEGTTVTVPTGVGTSIFLGIGKLKGIKFQAILMKFDFTVAGEDSGKTVASAVIDLPIRIVPDTLFSIDVTLHELNREFEESDKITGILPVDYSEAIPDSLGETVRTLDYETIELGLDTTYVNGWLNGTRTHNGIVMVWTGEPSTDIIIEMNAREIGVNPTVIRVDFTDTSYANYAVEKDYSVTSFDVEGLDCVGGIASRIYFEFSLDGLDGNAMIHQSSLVLTVDGSKGLGATQGESGLLTGMFNYYLYTPNVSDPIDSLFLSGTGIAREFLDPVVTETVRIPLRGFMQDVALDRRENTGMVLQSNLENVRVQRVSFFNSAVPDSASRPYLEVIYSLPAEFDGGR